MKGFRTIAFGAAMAVAPVLLNYLAGVHWTDYVSPEWAGIIVGGIVMVLRAVTTTPIGKAIIILALASSAMLLDVPHSYAADVNNPMNSYALKAPAATPCQVATANTPLSCSGWYVGAGLGGAGGNADIIGNGINGSVFAAGVTPVINAGYQYIQGNWLFGIDLTLGYDLGSNATVNGAGANANGFRSLVLFEVGGNANALLGNQTPITIPPLLANSILAPYAAIGTQWHQLAGSFANGVASGAGAKFDIGPRSFLDFKYVYTNYNGAKSGGLTLNNENLLLVTYDYKLN